MIDMGDFAGGLLKYLRDHPVERVTIGGGFGKMVKLAQGALDLHSGRSQVDFAWLAGRVPDGLSRLVGAANTALDVLDICKAHKINIAATVAAEARQTMQAIVDKVPIHCAAVIVDREGRIIAHAE
jgi:cobalt-precorrin-5B (C1)-methyltransferase